MNERETSFNRGGRNRSRNSWSHGFDGNFDQVGANSRGGRGRGGRGGRNHGRGGRWHRGNRGRAQGSENRHSIDGEVRSFEEEPREETKAESFLRLDPNTVVQYLVNHHNGSCLIDDLKERSGLFPPGTDPNDAIKSLQNCSNIKVLRNQEDLGCSAVRVIMIPLRLCFRHVPPNPCNSEKCRYLHLCRDFIMNCCYHGDCLCSHDVNSDHNFRLMSECGMQIFNAEQKLALIKCSNLMVCSEYNSLDDCSCPSSCFQLHMCNDFALGRCLILDSSCPEGHTLKTGRNKRILNLYRAGSIPDAVLFKTLLVFRKKPQNLNCRMANVSIASNVKSNPAREKKQDEIQDHPRTDSEFSHRGLSETQTVVKNLDHKTSSDKITDRKITKFTDFLGAKFEPLPQHEVSKNTCDMFEEHQCNTRNDCTDRHNCCTPFLWRVHVDGQWKNLEKNNLEIETAFCNPNRDEFFDLESIPNKCIEINFEEMSSTAGPIQRLTTPSYVKCRDQVDSTRWQWYWNDPHQKFVKWPCYEEDGEPPYQDVLEQKYQQDKKLICCFEIGKFFYELDFGTMTQTNLGTLNTRKVKRRPVLENRADWSPFRGYNIEYHCDLSKLPCDWVPMDTESKVGTELIPLNPDDDTYKDIKSKFFDTMNASRHTIRRIYRLQNLELWKAYQIKKDTIDNNTGKPTELMVYHGTAEEETARWICGVGFDQRMHGVNGTVYGKGAYFATTAKYSHGYTNPSPRNNLRYMFYAKITVGNVTAGNSSLKRPPPIDPTNPKKGLYDSCVNDIRDPSIYVIFENNQTYPAYLIEYKDIITDANVPPRQNAYAHGTSGYSQSTYSYPQATSSYSPATTSSYSPATSSYSPVTSSYTPATGSYSTSSAAGSTYVPQSGPTSSQYTGYAVHGQSVPRQKPPAPPPPSNPPQSTYFGSTGSSAYVASATSAKPKQSSCAVM